MKIKIGLMAVMVFTGIGLAQTPSAYSNVKIDPTFGAALGVRMGTGDINNSPSGYIGVKVNWFKAGDLGRFAFLSPGFGLQTNFQQSAFNISVAPFVYRDPSGFMGGVDLFLPVSTVGTTGIVGLFLGYDFN